MRALWWLVLFQAACAQTATPHAALRRVWTADGAPAAYLDWRDLPHARAYFGCNHMELHTVPQSGSRVRMDLHLTTLTHCEGQMAAEEHFHRLLPHIHRYTLRGNRLTLHADGQALHFHAAP